MIASTLIAQGEVLAQKQPSVNLSPLVAKSTVTAHTNPTKEISVILVLPLRDLKAATDYAERVNSPRDALFGKHLTPGEFAATYGGSEADYNSLESWAKTNGLKVSQRSVSRTTLTVRGTVAQFEALFKTQINNYRSPDGKEFYSASSKPTIPSSIPATVIGIIGLSSTTQFAPLAKVYKTLGETPAEKPVTDTAGGTGPGGAYSAADLRTAYNVPSHLGAGTPQTVAVFEQGGFDPTDVQKYLTTNKLPSVPVKRSGGRRCISQSQFGRGGRRRTDFVCMVLYDQSGIRRIPARPRLDCAGTPRLLRENYSCPISCWH